MLCFSFNPSALAASFCPISTLKIPLLIISLTYAPLFKLKIIPATNIALKPLNPIKGRITKYMNKSWTTMGVPLKNPT